MRRWERILGTPAPPPAEPGPAGRPRLSAAFAEWLMGIPGLVTALPGIPRTGQLRIIGNGAVPQQAALALGLLAARVLHVPETEQAETAAGARARRRRAPAPPGLAVPSPSARPSAPVAAALPDARGGRRTTATPTFAPGVKSSGPGRRAAPDLTPGGEKSVDAAGPGRQASRNRPPHPGGLSAPPVTARDPRPPGPKGRPGGSR